VECVRAWWATVPEWAKPVILAAAISAGLTFIGWFVLSAVPAMLKRLYIWVLEKQKAAAKELRAERLAAGMIHVPVTTDEIRKRSHVWICLIERAERWNERRKEYG
jgi:hypothetical protein